MNTYQPNTVLCFDKDFGVVTSSQIILKSNKNQDRINIDNIKSVRLIKNRVYIYNYIALALAALLSVFSIFTFQSFTVFSIGVLCCTLSLLLIGFLLKIHQYQLVVRDELMNNYILKTNQFKRENIKKFYNSIVKELKHHKKAA